MRKLVGTCVAALAVWGGLSSYSVAQNSKQAERDKVFTQLDKNNDGSITADEIGEAQQKAFKRLLRVGDQDKNGTLTRAEFDEALKPLPPVTGNQQTPGRRNGGRPQFDPREIFNRLDSNKDGKLTLSEIPEQVRPRFKPMFDRLQKEEITVEDMIRLRRGQDATNQRRFAEQTFKRLDRNGDGKLSKKEIPEDARRRFRFIFQRLMKDEITLDEYIVAIRRASDPRAIFTRFDADKNGKLTLSELPQPMRPRFKPIYERLGKDSLSQQEFARAFGRRPGQPPTDRKRPTNDKPNKKPGA